MKEYTKPVHKSHIFIILWGLLMHTILLWGVMDANFHSPIIPGLSVVNMSITNFPAKRIFIFVADGLRYKTFKDYMPPYLKSVIQKHGISGISHTRMPTESRPGNIAIVAGLYEDPSAVFKGWKENPVDFDSVFNHSRASWLWGSPDIIPLFIKDNHNIHGASYPATWQDFSNEPGTIKRLDTFVFEQYWHWLAHKGSDYRTDNKIIFYFHLLGCDTAGHAAKPHSEEYIEAMINVDKNIQKVVQETENYFGNGSTTYIFTSDHGMTDWGSHGSGSPDETETPFVAWGAGIAKNSYFYNIEQADITPLISSLIGIPVPINNEGILPYEILNSKYDEFIASAFMSNAEQLAVQVAAIRELTVGQSIVNMYWKDKEFSEKLAYARKLLQAGDTTKTINEIKYVTRLAKETLTYYRRYQTNRFLTCLLLMWIGWIMLLFVDLSGTPRQSIQLGCYSWNLLANISLIVISIPFIIEYTVASCKDWRLLAYGIICTMSMWLAFRAIIKKGPTIDINSNNPLIEFGCILTLILTMFVGLTYRWAFSISMLLAVGFQKLIFDLSASSFFVISGVSLALFPLLPVVGPQPRVYIVFIGLSVVMISLIRKQRIFKYNKIIEIIRIILTSLLCWNVIDGRSGLSWLLLLSTPIVIWLYPKNWSQRIFGITTALMSPFSLLSTSYEPIFFLLFAIHLQFWPISKDAFKSMSTMKILNLRSFSIAAFLMLYTLLCFFGTGNMSSISSFDPSWTRHFLTVFSPYIMSSLILLKIIIPLILVGCLIHALTPDSSIFSAVLLLGDCLAIPLMYGVTGQGSWLDIGSSISRFVIAIVLPSLLLVVYYLTKPFTTFSLQEFARRKINKNQCLKI